jgi:hypothetical protein
MIKKPIAVLIDGDNVQASIIEQLLFEVSRHWKTIIKRVFLNKTSIPKWEAQINQLSLTPVWVPNNTRGKNAADIELAVLMIARKYVFGAAIFANFCQEFRSCVRDGKPTWL